MWDLTTTWEAGFTKILEWDKILGMKQYLGQRWHKFGMRDCHGKGAEMQDQDPH